MRAASNDLLKTIRSLTPVIPTYVLSNTVKYRKIEYFRTTIGINYIRPFAKAMSSMEVGLHTKRNPHPSALNRQCGFKGRILYNRISLEFIAGGERAFAIIPEIDGVPLVNYVTIRKMDLASLQKRRGDFYSRQPGKRGDVICSYALFYPTKDELMVKIGNSSIENCVIRMYQQVPVVAVVSEIVVLKNDMIDREMLDTQLAQELKQKFPTKDLKIRTRTSKETISKSWKFVARLKSSGIIDELLEQGSELACEVSNILSKLGQVISPDPGYAWFSSLGTLSERDIELLVTRGYLSDWQSSRLLKLRHLPNGFFHAVLSAKGVNGQAVEGFLTYDDLKNVYFEVIGNE